jgi:hypothetical protein
MVAAVELIGKTHFFGFALPVVDVDRDAFGLQPDSICNFHCHFELLASVDDHGGLKEADLGTNCDVLGLVENLRTVELVIGCLEQIFG